MRGQRQLEQIMKGKGQETCEFLHKLQEIISHNIIIFHGRNVYITKEASPTCQVGVSSF